MDTRTRSAPLAVPAEKSIPRRIGRYHPPGAARRDLLLLLALALAIFAAGLGLRDPWPADEPRFALIAQEMVESGHWFFPHRASEIYAHKPPLFLWAIAAGYALTGSLRIAFLLPSLIAGLGTLALVYGLGRRLWHRRAGFAAGLALLTIVQFPLQAKTAQIDASVTFWTTLGLYGLCRHLLLGPQWRWWLAGWFAMGLGIITKGVGFLPLLVLVPWAWARRRGWRRVLPRQAPPLGGGWRWAAGPLLMLAAIGLWLVPMVLLVAKSGNPELAAYRDEILWGQTAERYASFEGHQKAFWYYPAQAIPSLWMPASLLLPWLVPAWVRRLRRRDARYLLLLGWIVLVVVFFTFSAGKRGVYILPAVPALALACGPLVAAGFARLRGPRWAAFVLLAFLSLVFLAAAGGGYGGAPWAREVVAKYSVEPWAPAAALGLAGLLWAAVLRPRRGVEALAGFLACSWLVLGLWIYPLMDPARSSSSFLRDVVRHLGPRTELAMVGWKEQMILQADRPVTHWGYLSRPEVTRAYETLVPAAARWLADGDPGARALLMPADWGEACFDGARVEPFGHWHGYDWVLAGADAVLPACPFEEGAGVRSFTTAWKASSRSARR